MTDYHRLTALEAARRIANGELTAETLVRACLERIAEREPMIGAWTYLDADQAIAEAQKRDHSPTRGPLHGVPVGVKDIIDTDDMPTEYGSPIYQGHRPPWDASCVALTRAAGGVILGKTVTTECAYYHPGKTANPHNPVHTPGGSSSGSAAAVADCMVPLAFGTQTAGSVIRPASFCGVVGYKPSYGTIDHTGVKPLAAGLDTVGVLTRSVADAAFLTSVLAAWPALRLSGQIEPAPRIGLCRTYEWDQAEVTTQTGLEEAAKRLAAVGAKLIDLTLPQPFADLAQAQTTIMAYEAARALAYEYHRHRDALSEPLRELIQTGQACPRQDYQAARVLAHDCRGQLDAVFADVDVLLAPSAPGEAPEGLQRTGDPVFNRIWTALGTPCVNLPGLTGPRGLPVGVQVIGRIGDDPRTLAAAAWIESRLQ